MLRKLQLGRTVKHLTRYRHILGVLFKYGFTEIPDALHHRMSLRLGGRRRAAPVYENRRPERLRMAFEELGPTFIKLGQLLSTRPDLLSPAYIEELEKLQDKVAPVGFEPIRREIESQLHGPLGNFYSNFDPQPIAAASIAQVHLALTRDGHKVAVKVRRPKVVEALKTECEILEGMAALLMSAMPRGDTIDPVRMVREFTTAVMRETDLTGELRNLQKFVANFAGDPTVHIAQPFESLCTSGVLTMEYIDGVKPTDAAALTAAGLDPKLIAARGADFVLKQVFDFGVFHTDPHPGNFLVQSGNVLAPLDFGQVARLTAADRYLLGELVLSIVEQDASRMIRAFRRGGMIGYATDVRALTAEMEEMLETYFRLPLEQVKLGRMMFQTFEVIRRHHVRPPPEFTMMLKSMMTIESLGTRLDGDFRIIDHLRPFARKITARQLSPRRMLKTGREAFRETLELASRLPEDISNILDKFVSGQFQMHVHHEHLESLIHTLDKASNRISFGLIIAGLVVGSSLLVTQERGTAFGVVHLQALGTLGYIVAAAMGLWLLISIIRSRHL